MRRRGLGVAQAPVQRDVDRATIGVLAFLGDTEHGRLQPRVGLGCAIGGEHRGRALADRIEHVGQEIEPTDIERADHIHVKDRARSS